MKKIIEILEKINNVDNTFRNTGINSIDDLIGGGYLKGELIAFAGHYGALPDEVILSIAVEQVKRKIPTAVFCLGDNSNYICKLVLKSILGHNRYEWNEDVCYDDVRCQMSELPLYIEEPRHTPESCISAIEEAITNFGITTFVLLSPIRIQDSSNPSYFSKELRMLTNKYGVSIFVRAFASYFDWECEGDIQWTPTIRNLSTIEGYDEYAHIIIGMTRPEEYLVYEDEKGVNLKNTLFLRVLKNYRSEIGKESYLRLGDRMLSFL